MSCLARLHDAVIMMNNDYTTQLVEQNKKLNDLLQNTVAQLEEERRFNMLAKNRVTGGYYMMNRTAEKNLRALQKINPTAALVFSVIRENMQIGTNAVTISNPALAKILEKSVRTIARATKHLADHAYVQIVKVGNTNTYVVNEQVAFAGSVGQRKAVFSATVVAHECEQEKGWDEVKKLKAISIIYSENEIIYD